MKCAEMVTTYMGSWPTSHDCGAPPKVERDGKWYCNRHDPEKRKAKDAAKAEAKAERFRPYREAVAALGCGYVPTFDKNPSIILNLKEAEALIARLKGGASS